MRWLDDLRFRLKALFTRREMEEELDEEFAFHLDMEARKLEAEGVPPEEARRLARVRFGGAERFKETARESWGVAPLTDMGGDVRFALRQLLKRPAFTALATLTLSLGIGGTVAIFSVVHGLMLEPLPVHDEDAIVTFWSHYDWRGAEFDFLKERVRAFESIAAYSDDAATLRTEAGSQLLMYSVGSAELFDVLGARPLLGRTFEEGEDRPGAEPVVVLGHGLWTREFGADRGILGRRLDLGGTLRTVVGVMPEGFYFPSPESDAWIPLDLDPASRSYNSNGWLVITGRLRDGTTDELLDEELARIAAALGERWDYPDAWDKSRDPYVVPLREYLLGDVRPALLLLLGGVGLILLMACANVTALLVTRTNDRTGEMSVRAALGAGQGRLARQVLTESVLLGLISGAIGVAIAVSAFDLLVASLPLPRELDETLALDWTALVAALALAVSAGCLVSLAPMHGLLRGDLSGSAFGSRVARGTAAGKQRLQRALVVAEVLTAVVLATGAALLMRTVGELRAIDWGVEPEGVQTVDVLLPEDPSNAETLPAFYDELVERVSAIPGVEAAGLAGRMPVRDGGWQGPVSLRDRPDLSGERRPNAYFRPMSPGAFEALGIEVIEGRALVDSDTPDGVDVAVINETFARSMFPGESAVGRVLEQNALTDGPVEIVGVIRDVAVDDLIGDVPMAVYYPWAQTFATTPYGILIAKTAFDPGTVVDPIRQIVAELAPRAAIGRVESMEEIMETAMVEPLRLRFFLGMFTLLGVVLGTVGVYGIVSYTVQQRSAEYGIRLALGAAPGSLLRDVVRVGMVPVALGVVAGTLVAMVGSTLLAGFLFEVEPTDPVSLASASAVLLVAGALAALVPAWRASATDPAVALRAE